MSIPNYLYALANHKGPATIDAGGMTIPVKIMDLEHESSWHESDKTTFKCLVVNEDQIRCYRPGTMSIGEYIHREIVRATNVKSGNIDPMKIKRVYFNNPVTVVIWEDGTKTIVRCQEGDVYSKETGLALCIAKKALGNKSNFNDVFHKYIPEEEGEVNE